MQAHIDRLEAVDRMLERLVKVLRGGYLSKFCEARQLLRLTIDDLSLEAGDERLDVHTQTFHQILLLTSSQSMLIGELLRRVNVLERRLDSEQNYQAVLAQ